MYDHVHSKHNQKKTRMIKLIITDMDGTFLNHCGDYNRPLFEETRQRMREQNVHFALCTGKQVERVEELLGAQSDDFWILGDSATRIKHRGEIIYQSLLSNQLGLDIIRKAKSVKGSHVVIACTPDYAAITRDTPNHIRELVKRSYTELKLVDTYDEITSDFVKITLYDENEQCPTLRPHLSEFDQHAYIVVSEAAWIDIANAGVHKGNTVAKLQALLNVTEAETMVFGDGLNDIELMARAQFSFAMRNAYEETKAAARYVTLSNDEDGVLQTILQFLALQKSVDLQKA